MVGKSTNVKIVENDKPNIMAVDICTHQDEVMPPINISRSMKSKVICVAIGIKPIIVVIVVNKIGLNLSPAVLTIASIGSFNSFIFKL